jgi:hypothetical protein
MLCSVGFGSTQFGMMWIYDGIGIVLHYNPVEHGLVACPHAWEFSSV